MLVYNGMIEMIYERLNKNIHLTEEKVCDILELIYVVASNEDGLGIQRLVWKTMAKHGYEEAFNKIKNSNLGTEKVVNYWNSNIQENLKL